MSSFQLNQAIGNFIYHCDDAINQLHSASTTEWLDASTSNNSLIGFFVSMRSNSLNHRVAGLIDNLQGEARNINCLLSQSPLRGRVTPLDTYFNGSGIRQAENSEHSLLWNIFGGSTYSSFASVGTVSELSQATNNIRYVRDQAFHMRNMLHCPPNPMECGTPFSHVYSSYEPCR